MPLQLLVSKYAPWSSFRFAVQLCLLKSFSTFSLLNLQCAEDVLEAYCRVVASLETLAIFYTKPNP